MPAKSQKLQWCKANIYFFNWNFHSLSLCSIEDLIVRQLNLHLDIAFAADLCLKAVNSNFLRNGWNITWTHSRHLSLWGWAGVSTQITNTVMGKRFYMILDINIPNLHISMAHGMLHILYSNWPIFKQEKNYCILVWCPDLKITCTNQRSIDFNILGENSGQKFHFLGTPCIKPCTYLDKPHPQFGKCNFEKNRDNKLWS